MNIFVTVLGCGLDPNMILFMPRDEILSVNKSIIMAETGFEVLSADDQLIVLNQICIKHRGIRPCHGV